MGEGSHDRMCHICGGVKPHTVGKPVQVGSQPGKMPYYAKRITCDGCGTVRHAGEGGLHG